MKKGSTVQEKTALDLPNLLRLHQPQEQLQACNNTKYPLPLLMVIKLSQLLG